MSPNIRQGKAAGSQPQRPAQTRLPLGPSNLRCLHQESFLLKKVGHVAVESKAFVLAHEELHRGLRLFRHALWNFRAPLILFRSFAFALSPAAASGFNASARKKNSAMPAQALDSLDTGSLGMNSPVPSRSLSTRMDRMQPKILTCQNAFPCPCPCLPQQ